MTVQYTEAGSTWRITAPYSAPKLTLSGYNTMVAICTTCFAWNNSCNRVYATVSHDTAKVIKSLNRIMSFLVRHEVDFVQNIGFVMVNDNVCTEKQQEFNAAILRERWRLGHLVIWQIITNASKQYDTAFLRGPLILHILHLLKLLPTFARNIMSAHAT